MKRILLLAGVIALALLSLALLRLASGDRGPSVADSGDPLEAGEPRESPSPLSPELTTPGEVGQASASPEEAGQARRAALPPVTARIAGRVDVAGGIPKNAGALVVAHAHRRKVSRLRSPRIEARVEADGSFEFVLPAGTSSVTLDLESPVLALSEEVEVKPGRLDVILRPLVFGGIRGRVILPAKIAGAGTTPGALSQVEITCSWGGPDPDGSSASVSDDETFSLTYLIAGEPLTVRAEPPWGPPVVLKLDPLLPGEIRDVVIELKSWITVSGIVVDEQGNPADRANVWISSEVVNREKRFDRISLMSTAWKTMMDIPEGDGTFRIEQVEPVLQKLQVQADGYLDPPPIEIDGRSGQDIAGLVVKLERGATITGTVRWPDGELAQWVEFRLEPGRMEGWQPGRFEVSGLVKGSYDVHATSRRDDHWGRAERRGVRAGEDIELVLEELPLLRGEVFGADGQPVDGFEVRVDGETRRCLGFFQTLKGRFEMLELSPQFADGAFELDDVQPGTRTISIHAAGHDTARRTIHYPEEAREVLQFVLGRPPIARGRVLDPEGHPCPHAMVFLGDRPDRGFTGFYTMNDQGFREGPGIANADEQGRFELAIESGGVPLTAEHPRFGNSLPLEVFAAPGQEIEGIELRLQPRAD